MSSAAMRSEPGTIFERAKEMFVESLTEKQKRDFADCSLEDVRKEIGEMQKKRGNSRSLRNMARLEKFLEGMDQYRKVVEAFLNCTPFLGYVWGPIRLVLLVSKMTRQRQLFLCGLLTSYASFAKVANTWIVSLDTLLDAYADIGERLPSFVDHQSLFERNKPMRRALEVYYSDILKFNYRAMKFITRPGWKMLFKASWKTFDAEFRQILNSLAKHKAMIEDEKATATLYEVQKSRDIAESQAESQEQTGHISMLLKKLNAPDYDIDQRAAAEHRENRSAGSWILDDERFQKWANVGLTGNPSLYIHGSPGSGKTTLASFIIESLQRKKSAPVVFFYCKHDQQGKRDFNGLLRALTAQLSYLGYKDAALAHSLHDLCSSNDQSGVSLVLEELATVAFESQKLTYVVLDGLDECSPKQTDRILSWFQSYISDKNDADSGLVRLLCIGQRVHILQKKLIKAVELSLENSSHLKDIQHYVENRARDIAAENELCLKEEADIVAQVVSSATSMFLYANLVMDFLADQPDRHSLYEALKPASFPVDLKAAYERVVSIIFRKSPLMSTSKSIISWVACAGRPLKWREVQATFYVDPTSDTCDFGNRRLRKLCKEYCGSLIDVHKEDSQLDEDAVLNMAHRTACDYLIGEKLVDVSLQNAKMAIFCTEYLTSSPFHFAIDVGKLEANVKSGYYAIQDYAVSHWFQHMTEALPIGRASTIPIDVRQILVDRLRCFVADYGVLEKRQELEILGDDGRVLEPFPKAKSTWSQWFDLERRSIKIRRVIEAWEDESASDGTGQNLKRRIYGEKLFRCPKVVCTHFDNGFDLETARDEHMNLHERPFLCVEQDCPFGILGFDLQAKLESHLAQHRPKDDGDGYQFPKAPSKKKTDTIFKACVRGDISAVKSFLDNDACIVNKAKVPTGMETPLFLAAKNGRLHICKMLLERGADINYQGKPKITALDAAASSDHLGVVQFFIGCRDLRDQSQRTFSLGPFNRAVISSSTAVFQFLLSHQTDEQLNRCFDTEFRRVNSPNTHDISRSPLMYAAEAGHEDIVIKLLSIAGVDLNLKAKVGNNLSALLLAVLADQEAVVKILVSDPRTHLNIQDGNGQTAISLAARYGQKPMVKLLLKVEHINPNAISNSGQTPLRWALDEGRIDVAELLLQSSRVIAGLPDNYNRTPLSYAAAHGNVQAVQLLLKYDELNADLSDSQGRTPLGWAISREHKETIKVLLRSGKVNAKALNEHSGAALTWAAEWGDLEAVKCFLLESKMSADLPDSSGRTPLSWAAGERRTETVELLLASGKVTANLPDKAGRTPLSWATGNGHTDTVSTLLLNDAVEADLSDSSGRTPLSWAAEHDHIETVKSLLQLDKVEADLPDSSGRTPLSWAAEHGHTETVKILLQLDEVEADLPDSSGRTPLSRAVEGESRFQWRHIRTIDLLLSMTEVNVNSKDNTGRTPLFHTLKTSYIGQPATKAIELLLDAGADPMLRDLSGESAIDFAVRNKYDEAVKLLRAAVLRTQGTGEVASQAGHSKRAYEWHPLG